MAPRSILRSLGTGSRSIGWLALLILTGLLTGLRCPVARAQASLAAEDTDELAVNQHKFTVIRDANNRNLWYYVPDQPRIVEDNVNGQVIPELNLFRIQYEDPTNHSIHEGGLLQFAASLEIPTDDLEPMKALIAAKYQLQPQDVRLAALPIKDATVAMYAPKTGEFIASGVQGNGVAPTFATQKMVFLAETSQAGTDLYNAIVKSDTGIPLAVIFHYQGLTPEMGFTATFHWRRIYDYYSSDAKFKAQASYYGLFGASTNDEWQSIAQTCLDQGLVEIHGLADPSLFDPSKMIQPILNTFTQMLVEAQKPPDKIDPAHASDPNADGFFAGVGYNFSDKKVDINTLRDVTIDYHVRYLQDRMTVASGFVGLRGYPPAVQDNAVVTVERGHWDKTYFTLPTIGDSSGVSWATLTVTLHDPQGTFADQQQAAVWTPTSSVDKFGKPVSGWLDAYGKATPYLSFPLANLGLSSDQIGRLQFQSVLEVAIAQIVPPIPWPIVTTLSLTDTRPAADAQYLVQAPTSKWVDSVVVDGSALTFQKLDKSNKSKLIAVSIRLSTRDRSVNLQIKPTNVNGQWQLSPSSVFWLVRTADDPVVADIEYLLDDGTYVPSRLNGNVRGQQSGLFLNLLDSDWNRQ